MSSANFEEPATLKRLGKRPLESTPRSGAVDITEDDTTSAKRKKPRVQQELWSFTRHPSQDEPVFRNA
ncbi:hypothetical protein H2198_008023 [Neophaeococcomyces mojaviensis]|uniref:Uncharacterized protein n=1 Tax=Neophaeococcomyces mojaviensis TaxID=3383035 RepID=A0ACC2ZYF5_9EURO|nr:hypothetical protein H2198_008023 [Knufia sp. JES_112]